MFNIFIILCRKLQKKLDLTSRLRGRTLFGNFLSASSTPNKNGDTEYKTITSPHLRYFHGYTLVEIVVTVTILAILFTVGYANFKAFQRNQIINLVTSHIVSDLHSAQNKALTGEKVNDSKCNSPKTLTGYEFKQAGGGYTISIVCSGGIIEVKNVSIVDFGVTGVTLSLDRSLNCSSGWLGGSNVVTFNALGNGTNLPPGACVRIKVSMNPVVGAKTRYIYVDSSGTIREL